MSAPSSPVPEHDEDHVTKPTMDPVEDEDQEMSENVTTEEQAEAASPEAVEDGDESLDKPQVEGSAPASPEAPGSPDDAAGSPPGSPPASPPQESGPASPIASPRDSTSAPGSPEAVEKPQMDEEGLEKPAPSSPGGSPVRNADDSDEEEVVSPKKARVMIDSDEEEIDDGAEKTSPEKLKRKKVMMDSDSDDDEATTVKRKLLGSDVSDSEHEDDEGRPRGEEEVGELMANIFGDDSDDDDANKDKPAHDDDDDDLAPPDDMHRHNDRDDDDGGIEWDFDKMLREKKAEKKKKKRRRDGGIDIINDDDGTIASLVEAMKNATKEDRISNMERKPALRKRKMLPEVKTMLLRIDLVEAMIDNGMMSAVSDWLSPLPDKSLPALEIRTELLKLLQGFTRLDQGILKQSGLGKAVMMLYKHPREIKQNKEIAAKLIREWARPIFQLDTDFRSISKEDRLQRDLDHMPAVKARRMSQEGAGTSKGGKEPEVVLRPGDKGYIGRARVPRPSTKDYVYRPRSNVEGVFKGERKSRGFNRLDKAQREFVERTKKNKAKRAVNVSLEGRNMAL